jgi:hypothetical protein
MGLNHSLLGLLVFGMCFSRHSFHLEEICGEGIRLCSQGCEELCVRHMHAAFTESTVGTSKPWHSAGGDQLGGGPYVQAPSTRPADQGHNTCLIFTIPVLKGRRGCRLFCMCFFGVSSLQRGLGPHEFCLFWLWCFCSVRIWLRHMCLQCFWS